MNEILADGLNVVESLNVQLIRIPPIYGSLAGSINYWSNRLEGQLWSVSPQNVLMQALVTATSTLNNLRYAGSMTLSTQALEFPRNGSAVVPIAIQDACYELAMAFLKGVDAETEYAGTFASLRSFGQIETRYDYGMRPPEHIVAGVPSLRAWHLIRPFLSKDLTILYSPGAKPWQPVL